MIMFANSVVRIQAAVFLNQSLWIQDVRTHLVERQWCEERRCEELSI